jgi:hypothetical protein
MLDGSKNTLTKDAFYDVLRPRTSATFTRNKQEHKAGRIIWSHALATRCKLFVAPFPLQYN